MKILNVPDMHCGHCVRRITDALNQNGIEFEVSLENKTVSVANDSTVIEKTLFVLDDLGFCAE